MLNEVKILNLHVGLSLSFFEPLHPVQHLRDPLKFLFSFDETRLHSVQDLIDVTVDRKHLVRVDLVCQLEIINGCEKIALLYVKCEP